MGTKIISRFGEKPKSRTGWWAFGLGLGTLLIGPLLGTSAAVFVPLVDNTVGEAAGRIAGFGVALFALLLTIAAVAAVICALKMGERSWAVWFGLFPAAASVAFWVLLVAGEFLFPH